MHQLDLGAIGGDARRIAAAQQQILDRAQQQGQRRAEFVTGVREKGGLGPVDLGQCLGPAAFDLIGLGGGETGADLPGDQAEEALIVAVERAIRVDAGDEHPGRARLALVGDRQHDRLAGWLAPRSLRQIEAGGEIADDHRRRGAQHPVGRPWGVARANRETGRSGGMAIGKTAGAGQLGDLAGFVEQIGQAERQIVPRGQTIGGGGEQFGQRAAVGDGGGELPQQSQPPLADDPLGFLRDDA